LAQDHVLIRRTIGTNRSRIFGKKPLSVKLPPQLADITVMSMQLRNRIVSHAEKIRNIEEMEAAMVGVFDEVAQDKREKFETLAQNVIAPAFEEFKTALRQIGRDAVIVSNLTHHPVQSVGLILVDRYLKFGIGKTLNLVNPKEDISQRPNTKFYEVYRIDDCIYVKERAVAHLDPVSTQIACEDIIPQFMENELTRFFERAYPVTS
jgi:hypothetical protein